MAKFREILSFLQHIETNLNGEAQAETGRSGGGAVGGWGDHTEVKEGFL